MITNNGHRDTKQKTAILDFLKTTRSHPTADQVYDAVRKRIPKISKGTIYRNLQVLVDDGSASVLDISGTVSRYELKQGIHYHFRCDACGRVYDLDEPVDQGLEDRISKRTSFLVSGHQTEFRGRCANCLRPSQQINVKES